MMSKHNSDLRFAPVLTEELDEHPHSHDFFEIFYITLGNITHIYSDKKERLGIGEACLICPDNSHRFIRKGKCTHRDLIIGKALFKEACDFISPTLFEELKQKRYVRFSLSTETITYLEKCFYKYLESEDTIRRKNYERVLISILLSHVYFNPTVSEEIFSNFKDKCIHLLNSNFIKPNALEIIREQLGYNEIYFSRKFKKKFGCTPTTYITNRRLEHAVYLLTSSNFTLDECCAAIGIYSLPYFIKIFKKKYGMTPSQYKNQRKKL